ncbi:NADH-quinone oxidoreductase subunit M [Dactylococcopsis salina]|uniref:Proton-translocating NADH-quinone oxidoreductase, chain M n=1 Tax=Dactylococcopsis salina (strain PCC 8305) TaxID=13035 RepID=K9YV03_DACS8|nr:NADH-quinone oxidoreductase subunit M [Dactylococcopsis salina]AFZ50347.1 proton-translocating NADH-quinone oxidoreductase, chain M [Dactylococcopsis salina PCC 8305]
MLTALLVIPVIGVLIVSLLPSNLQSDRLRQITLFISIAPFLWTIYLFFQFDLDTGGFQFSEFIPWLEPIGLNYHLSIDGISLPLVSLNSFLSAIAIYSTSLKIERQRLYYVLILLVNFGVAGALMAQNLLLFFLFYEVELIPFYLLISIWGGEKRGYAATKFILYTAVSGLLIIAAFLGLAFLNKSGNFEYETITTAGLSLKTQLILLTLILVGFGMKTPLVPLHTWQPDAYVEASPPVAILLGGVLAKLGTYGIIRFGLQLFPETWNLTAPGLAIIGVISVIYGALTAIAQTDIKRMVAYSSIGHMGYILVASAAGTSLSVLGAVAQMISHGLILALLFQLIGTVEEKVGTRDRDVLNGLMNPIRGLPLTSGLLIAAGMASAGIPGLVGFVAEYIVFQGSFSRFPIETILCIIASGLTAVYFVILLNRTCFGKLDNSLAYYPQVLWSERLPALILTLIIFAFGIQPNWLVHWIEPTTNQVVSMLTPKWQDSYYSAIASSENPQQKPVGWVKRSETQQLSH